MPIYELVDPLKKVGHQMRGEKEGVLSRATRA